VSIYFITKIAEGCLFEPLCHVHCPASATHSFCGRHATFLPQAAPGTDPKMARVKLVAMGPVRCQHTMQLSATLPLLHCCNDDPLVTHSEILSLQTAKCAHSSMTLSYALLLHPPCERLVAEPH
jgi:hypothetical protein